MPSVRQPVSASSIGLYWCAIFLSFYLSFSPSSKAAVHARPHNSRSASRPHFDIPHIMFPSIFWTYVKKKFYLHWRSCLCNYSTLVKLQEKGSTIKIAKLLLLSWWLLWVLLDNMEIQVNVTWLTLFEIHDSRWRSLWRKGGQSWTEIDHASNAENS